MTGARTEPAASGRGGGSVQSVERAARLLEILAREGEASSGAIARELGVHGSTITRLAAALEAHELVSRGAGAGGLQLGAGLLRLADAARLPRDLASRSAAVCEELAARLGETVNVAVLREGAAVNLFQAQGPSSVAMHNWVGDRTVLHATSSGKVLLAQLPSAEAEALLAVPLERFTPATSTDPDALLAELALVRERGWATAVEEFEPGLNAVAVPILRRGEDGQETIGALSIAGPAYRMAPGRLQGIAAELVAGAEDISRRLAPR
ncbi:IclR family transcriptional regulator [Brachybacterium hainanense]|uniref:IclR family transcriptional regulator n=1 Tax=Brachybacterium hainanense TaxID=1541174 RepID=A0ABV6R9B9_9MICO